MTIREYGFGIELFLIWLSPLVVYLFIYFFAYKQKKGSKSIDKTSEDGSLATLRYVWWKLAWLSYFPYTFFWSIFFLGSHSYSESSDVNGLIKIGIFIVLIGVSYFLVERLLTKKIILYGNRIEKHYFALFSTRQVIISSAIYSTTNSSLNFILALRDKKQTKLTALFFGLDIDLSLCKKNDVEYFISVLAKLTGRTIEEIAESSLEPISLEKESRKGDGSL